MGTRIYVVKETKDGTVDDKEYLIDANNPSQAIRHVVKDRFTATPAKSSDVARLMKAGVEVEEAVVDPAE